MNSTYKALLTKEKCCLRTIMDEDPYTVLGFSVYPDWNGKKVLKLIDTSGIFFINNIELGLFKDFKESKYYTLGELGIKKSALLRW